MKPAGRFVLIAALLVSGCTAADTGPRVSAVQSLSGSAAMAAVRSAPVEADGKKYLRRTNITGTTSMSDNGDTGIVFEDCTFTGGSTYVVNAFQAGIEPTNGPDFYPEFRYCEISGGSSATIIGGYSRFLRCNIHFGIDLVKAFEEGEFYGCYLHGNNHPSGAHCDTFQITTGAANRDRTRPAGIRPGHRRLRPQAGGNQREAREERGRQTVRQGREGHRRRDGDARGERALAPANEGAGGLRRARPAGATSPSRCAAAPW